MPTSQQQRVALAALRSLAAGPHGHGHGQGEGAVARGSTGIGAADWLVAAPGGAAHAVGREGAAPLSAAAPLPFSWQGLHACPPAPGGSNVVAAVGGDGAGSTQAAAATATTPTQRRAPDAAAVGSYTSHDGAMGGAQRATVPRRGCADQPVTDVGSEEAGAGQPCAQDVQQELLAGTADGIMAAPGLSCRPHGMPSSSPWPGPACAICLDAPAVVGFQHGPTVHQCACGICADKMIRAGGRDVRCPLCRQAVQDVFLIHAT